jgi:hypothetical protein
MDDTQRRAIMSDGPVQVQLTAWPSFLHGEATEVLC